MNGLKHVGITNRIRNLRRQVGMTLVEIMIALLIGMVVCLMAANGVSMFMAFSKTSISGNNALTNGIMALYNIQHDVSSSGLGFVANSTLTCSTMNAVYGGSAIATNTRVAPIMVTAGGTSAPDSFDVIYGDSILSSVPMIITANAGSTATVAYAGTSVAPNDYAIISTPGTGAACTMVRITSVAAGGGNMVITYDDGGAATAITPGTSIIMDIGTLHWVTWSVDANKNLITTDRLDGTVSIIADNVVQMKLQYGTTTVGDPAITSWQDPSGAWDVAVLTAAQMGQIRAVRVAVMTRSNQREKGAAGGGACTTTTTAPLVWPGATAVNLSGLADWQCYRYTVVQTVIPLKNIVIGGVT